jgi:hypothetical protein
MKLFITLLENVNKSRTSAGNLSLMEQTVAANRRTTVTSSVLGKIKFY